MTSTHTPPDVDDLLAGGSASISWKDAPVGHTVSGTVVTSETVQENDYDTGEPKFYSDGNPAWQVVVTLQTDLREEPDDDGQRRLYLRGQMFTALRKEMARTKAKLRPGGVLSVTFDHTEPAKNPRHNDRKIYTVHYVSPSEALTDAVLSEPAAPANAYAPPAAASTPAANTITAAQAEVMRSNGIAIPPGVTIAG